jgi:hypothetical protein
MPDALQHAIYYYLLAYIHERNWKFNVMFQGNGRNMRLRTAEDKVHA